MAGKELHQQEDHRQAGDGRQPRDAGRDAVGQVERGDGEGVGAPVQAGQELVQREGRWVVGGEETIERLQDSEIVLHPPVRPSRRRARTRCGLSSILPSSVSTPEPGLLSNVSTTRFAQSTSCAVGVKTSWMTATWSGWMAILPP